jgi:hypothetical protein
MRGKINNLFSLDFALWLPGLVTEQGLKLMSFRSRQPGCAGN